MASAGTYYIAPNGSDAKGDGSADRPWATIHGATTASPDDGSTVIVRDGLYIGAQDFGRHFRKPCLIKSEHPYRARFRSTADSTRAFQCYEGSNAVFEGLEFFGSGGTGSEYVMHIATKNTHDLTFVDCIIHDSFRNDLVKINDECHHITFRGCLLYNVPDGGDELFDINVVTDIVVEDCILLSDQEGSGRPNRNANQALIVIKNSSGPGRKDFCRRIAVRRNVFCNWEGRSDQSYVLVGEDAKDFWEAQDVTIENNLFLFNNTNRSTGAITLKCHVRNVTIRANTVCGTVYGYTAYALRCSEERAKLGMESVSVCNNLFADPAGKMPRLVYGLPKYVKDFSLRNNLYWNGGKAFPHDDGSLAKIPSDDPLSIAADPLLEDPSKMTIPRWMPWGGRDVAPGKDAATSKSSSDGSGRPAPKDAREGCFLSGKTTVRSEFERLVATHGTPPDSSPAIGKADGRTMPADDILGRKRGLRPTLGAVETGPVAPTPTTSRPAPASSASTSR